MRNDAWGASEKGKSARAENNEKYTESIEPIKWQHDKIH